MSEPAPSAGARVRAYAVHAYTASGVGFAFFAAMEIASAAPRPVIALLFLAAAVVVDATDGPLARAWNVKLGAPEIDGRTIDDIVDYLTFTFLPLLLVWRMEWLPEPAAIWVVPALIASLFGFANVGAKDEEGGFFRGFPSYWNVVALYAGIVHHHYGPGVNAVIVLALAALTLAPVGFLYPNLAPPPWKLPMLLGAAAWLAVLLAMLRDYPRAPVGLLWASLAYPAFYTLLSLHLQRPSHAAHTPGHRPR